jgi:hypothetical protein
MKALLNLDASIVSYLDNPATSNPKLRPVDWQTSKCAVPVNNPSTRSFQLAPYQTVVLFNGAISTSIDGTTTFNITLNPINVNTYRFTAVSGTAPAFRPNRGLTLATTSVTLTDLGNSSLQFTGTGGDLAAVQVGDTLLIPGVTTGDSAGPFNLLNEGFWQVIGVLNTSTIVLTRPAGMTYSFANQTVTVASNPQVIAFGPTGVQVGNSVDLNLGSFPQVLGTFAVQTVTPTYFEIVSTLPLPLLTGIMPNTGMAFFSEAKAYAELYTDQSCSIQANNSSDSSERLDPWRAGSCDPNDFGYWKKVGLLWALYVTNRTAQSLNLVFISTDK